MAIDLSLKGKTALVCGASQGIGAATAMELAKQGARVVLAARSEDKLREIKEHMENPSEHLVWTVDLCDSKTLASSLEQLLKEVGTISIVVNNAGGPKAGPLIEASEEDFLAGFYTHVIANQLIAQAVVPGMKYQGFGRFINIISTSVKAPIANLGVSNTIRGAVASWAKTMATELGGYGITVNNVLPGFTDTPRLQKLKESAGQRLSKSTKQVDEMWQASVPAGRFADPRETAAAVTFLASKQASYINGINVPVDGGRTVCL